MSDMFENFSLIMYLLPSIRQHPEYQLHNALTHITPRNVLFSEGEKCLMVLHSMPKAVQLECTKDHPKKPIPVDLTSLIIELQPILDKYREELDSKSQKNQGGGGGSPQKQQQQRGSQNGTGGNSNRGGGQGSKFCKRCDKARKANPELGIPDSVVKSHDAADCKRFDANGKALPRR